MDDIIESVRRILETAFNVDVSDVSIGGGAVFVFLVILLILIKAFVTHIQEFMKVYLNNKANFAVLGIFLAGLLLFFFLELPLSLMAWFVAGTGLIIGRLALGARLKIRVGVLIGLTVGIAAPCAELYYNHLRTLRNQGFEVYFLLPRDRNMNKSEELAEIRKSLYDVFSKVFDLKGLAVLESIIVYPKSYLEYDDRIQIDALAEPSLVKRVLTYGSAEKTPLDIVIRGTFRYHRDQSLIVLVVNYQKPDAENRRLVNLTSGDRIQGGSEDLDWISLLACYEFIGFIRNRTIHSGEDQITIADHETYLLKNILTQYRDFLLTQITVDSELLEHVNDSLAPSASVTYSQTGQLLRGYAPKSSLENLDASARKTRTAAIKKVVGLE